MDRRYRGGADYALHLWGLGIDQENALSLRQASQVQIRAYMQMQRLIFKGRVRTVYLEFIDEALAFRITLSH